MFPLYPGMPNLHYEVVWSDDVCYTLEPDNVTWDTDHVLIEQVNHNIVDGDEIFFESTDVGSDWNFDDVADNGDADTFTVPLVADPGDWPNGLIDGVLPGSGTKERVTITVPAYSKLMFTPHMLQLETIPGGTTIQLQVKLAPSAAWKDLGAAWTNADEGTIYVFANDYNYVRIALTGGTDLPLIYSSK